MNFVLLRGLLREQRHWESFPDRLRQASGAHVVCLDFPGIGTEAQRPSPTSVAEIREDLRDRFRALKLSGDTHLISISLGSMLGIDWTYRYPNDFKSLVVMNPSARNVGSVGERFSLKLLPGILWNLASLDPVKREKAILRMTSNVFKGDLSLAKKWSEFSLSTLAFSQLGARQLWAASRFEIPKQHDSRALVLCSLKDQMVSPTCSYKIAKNLNWPIKINSEAGHDLPLDDPEWTIKQILDFVD